MGYSYKLATTDSDMPTQLTGTSRGTSPHSSSSPPITTSPPPATFRNTFRNRTHLLCVNTVSTCGGIRRDEYNTVGCDINQPFTQVEEQVRYHSTQIDDSKTNHYGGVGASRRSFSKLIETAAFVPRLYEYAPFDTELYKTEDEEEQAGRRMFDFVVVQGMDVINVNEWSKLCVEDTITKVATFKPHLILDHGIEEEFKAFVKAALVRLMFSRDVSPPANADGGCHGAKEQDVSPPVDPDNGRQGTLPQQGGYPDVSRDVSPPAEADKGNQGLLSQHGGQPDASRDVSPPDDADSDRQGTLSQPGDADLHGDKERRQEEKEVTQLGNTAHEHSAAC